MTPSKKSKDTLRSPASPSDTASLYPYAQILCQKGQKTTKVTNQLVKSLSAQTRFNLDPNVFQVLAESLSTWSDDQSAIVVRAVTERMELIQMNRLELSHLRRWITIHTNDENAVRDCLFLDPPRDVFITQRLSQTGSQKLVFLANWRIAQREIVLKKFKQDSERLLYRELTAHPLSLSHPNIIKTYALQNDSGEKFLVEDRLPLVLHDAWKSQGINESANLLYHISNALAFLENNHLVHGDVKPDNIGSEEGRYILLDFGICRPISEFGETSTPTGSLRTRAPEVLLDESKQSYASDIWALGATVFNAIVGRFPLFDVGESPPRSSHPDERKAYIRKLAQRATDEWGNRVEFSSVNEPLRSILEKILTLEPSNRLKATEVVKECEKQLAAFLRGGETASKLSPGQELEQLKHHLPDAQILGLIPTSKKQEIESLLNKLADTKGFTEEQKKDIALLTATVRGP